MKVAANTVVTMTYVLHRETAEGQIIQETPKDQPFEAIFGHGMLLPKFEENLDGLEPGDTFGFALSPEEGYGERIEENIIKMDAKNLLVNGVFNQDSYTPGKPVNFRIEGGQIITGIVVESTPENVTFDFNHELAGVPLFFTGEILNVREAEEADFSCGHHCSDESCEDCGCDGCH